MSNLGSRKSNKSGESGADSHWYLFDEAGLHRGPLPIESLVRAIHAGDIARDTLIATQTWAEPLSKSTWRPAHAVPEIATRISELKKTELAAKKLEDAKRFEAKKLEAGKLEEAKRLEARKLEEAKRLEARKLEEAKRLEARKLEEAKKAQSARKLNIIPGAFTTDRRGALDFGATVMMMPSQSITPKNES